MILRIANVLAFAVMVVMNYLANALPIGGNTTEEISALYPNLFVPAGFTFSIWGLIYLLLLGFVILQFRDQNRTVVDDIGWLFVISSLLNSLWIVAWHNERVWISVLIISLLLVSLIMINHRLATHPTGLIWAAFGIYLGWILIATIANITAALVSINWAGWGLSDEFWAVVMVLAGAIISFLVLRTYRNPYTGLAVIWALLGVVAARWPVYISIIIAAAVAILTLSVITGIILLQRTAS